MPKVEDFQELVRHLQVLQGEAHRLGFHETAHALNEAMNKCGWEYLIQQLYRGPKEVRLKPARRSSKQFRKDVKRAHRRLRP
jgi:hypothetical protein